MCTTTRRLDAAARRGRRFYRGVVLPACAVLISPAACSEDAFRLPDFNARYIAFGDSSTAGPSERDYVDSLRERLGEPAEAFANEGRGGESAAEGADRLTSYLDRRLFPNAHTLLYWEGAAELIDFLQEKDPLLALSPDHPAYPYGAALAARLDETQASLERALAAGRDAGLTVYAATYFFMPSGSLNCEPLLLGVLLPGQADNANAYVALLNERIRAAAAAQGATVVDVATLDASLRGSAANYHNCNHLSAAGNEIVAGLFFDVIQPGPP